MVWVAAATALVVLVVARFRILVVRVASSRCAKHPMLRYKIKTRNFESRLNELDILMAIEDIFGMPSAVVNVLQIRQV